MTTYAILTIANALKQWKDEKEYQAWADAASSDERRVVAIGRKAPGLDVVIADSDFAHTSMIAPQGQNA